MNNNELMEDFKNKVQHAFNLLKDAVVFSYENNLNEDECMNYTDTVLNKLEEEMNQKYGDFDIVKSR